MVLPVGPGERPQSRAVLCMRVDAVTAQEATAAVLEWAAAATPGARYVCAANVHMVMTAHDDPSYAAVVNRADLVLPDGVPMVWALRALGLPQKRRVRVAPDLVIELLAGAEARGLAVGLYGGTPHTLPAVLALLRVGFPRLDVAYAWSPPFRPLTAAEDHAQVERIRSAGVRLLLVGIGCPKQERWMATHVPRRHCSVRRTGLDCAMVGVGAAFDVLAGRTGDAPPWMRDRGLEWAYRLAAEPRRLWRRYLLQNPRFVALFAAQLFGGRRRATEH